MSFAFTVSGRGAQIVSRKQNPIEPYSYPTRPGFSHEKRCGGRLVEQKGLEKIHLREE
jgi:hypothetical protein